MKQFYQLKIGLLMFFSVVSLAAMAQSGTVSGKVLDNDNGEPIIGANASASATTPYCWKHSNRA